MDINLSVISLNVVVWCTLSAFFDAFSTVSEPFFYNIIKSFSLFKLRIRDKICIHSDKIVYRGLDLHSLHFTLTQLQLKKPFDETGH